MRIAVLIPSLHGGGAEFVALQWGEYLRTAGHEVTFVTTHVRNEDRSVDLGGAWFGGRVLRLRAMLRRREFDVVISLAPHWNLISVVASVLLRVRPIRIISGRTIETGARHAGNNKAIELFLAKFFYRLADAYVAISHPTAAEAQAIFGIKSDRLFVVPNPALGKVESTPALKKNMEQASTGTSGVLNIVVPGRLTRSKRPLLGIAVAKRCAEISGRRVQLHFFGSGVEERAVEEVAVANVDIILHGWVERWFDAAPNGAVVLLPSRIEGFANVLIEAAAAGFPAVASSRALGVCDALVPGLTGQLALTDSPEDLAEAVLLAEDIRPGSEIAPWLERFKAGASGSAIDRVIHDARKRLARLPA